MSSTAATLFRKGNNVMQSQVANHRSFFPLLCYVTMLAFSFSTAFAQHATLSDSSYAKHVARLQTKLPGPEFTIVVQPPFVVIGDEAPKVVKRRADQTVQWAADKLKKLYFDKDPVEILDIWLFKDKESYEKNAQLLFGDKPDTPYGYFSHAHRALVMNISTGGGTLVHEIVHPFVAANFPQCPSWFNEGLGSLYEQSEEKDGQIHGLPNWRLPGLQKAIRDKTLGTFKDLCTTTTEQFYGDRRGTNYGQARYLCYYLQEKGLLVKFYRQFHENCKDDPPGYESLQKILGRRDMDAFQKEWEAYVMGLRF